MSKVWEHEPLPDRYSPPEKSDGCQMIHGQAVKIHLSVAPVIHRKLDDGVVDIVYPRSLSIVFSAIAVSPR